jgi:ferredoxin--NADP+ reductase
MIEIKERLSELDNRIYSVQKVEFLTDSAFIITLPKARFKFEAGQHIICSSFGKHEAREYSIYNGVDDDRLEILVKEVVDGYFTPVLKRVQVGDFLKIDGPHGRFSLDTDNILHHKHIFIATGTGIAPFHSIVKSNPKIDFQIIHGVRTSNEAYQRDHYSNGEYVLCTTSDQSGDYKGRLTGYLQNATFPHNTLFYLCGNGAMVYEAKQILKRKGFSINSLFSEVYF